MIKSEPVWSYFGAVLPDSAGRIDEHRSKRRLVRGGWLFIDIIVDSGVTNHGALAQGKRVIIGEPPQSSSTFGREDLPTSPDSDPARLALLCPM